MPIGEGRRSSGWRWSAIHSSSTASSAPTIRSRDHHERWRRIGHQRRQGEDREQSGECARESGRGDGEASSCDETEARREEERRHGVADCSSGWVGVGRIPNVLNGQ